jgi:uncharacterized membrane protein HdeD (DUF308 family)
MRLANRKETPVTQIEMRAALSEATASWWLFLVAAGVWFVIALVVLRLNLASVATVGVLLGAVFLLSAIEEFFVATVQDSWVFLRAIAGVLFVFGAVWCFVSPLGAFWSLAIVLGFLLVFKGTLDLIESIAAQGISSVWWFGMIAGVLEIGLGFWASTQVLPERALLLLLWVGLAALFRGFSDIALAFSIKAAD